MQSHLQKISSTTFPTILYLKNLVVPLGFTFDI